MRKLLRFLFKKPIAIIAEKLSSSPRERDVHKALSRLLKNIRKNKRNKGFILPFESTQDKFIIFSDQHKGIRDGGDDFRDCEGNYLAALSYYDTQGFGFISLGDCEEMWKYPPEKVMKHNDACFSLERRFLDKNRYYRVYGNHDLIWKYRLQQNVFLKPVFGKNLRVFEGLILQTTFNQKPFSILLTHGHQGDLRGMGSPFSIWIVANIWTPIQRYLGVSINTPATSFELTDKHNSMMYEWSAAQHNLVLISGHTHKPVFASFDHIEKITKQLEAAKATGDGLLVKSLELELKSKMADYNGKKHFRQMARPTYFNSGCCCFEDGDITGIEIAEGHIRLVKWDSKEGAPCRKVLEESILQDILQSL